MKGYELKMSGSRVGELLSRQFVVPTLDVPPASETLSWEDGKYTITFRIGELCRVQENGEWKFYRLQDIKGNIAFWVNANASEAPDLSNYYTKEEVDEKVGSIEIPEVELDDYYTKEEVDNKIDEGVSGSVRSVSYNSGVKIKPDENGNVDLIITDSNYILRLKTTVDGVAPYRVALGNEYNMTVEVSNKFLDGGEQVSVSTACTATFYCNGLVVNTQEVYDGEVIKFNFGKFFTEGKNTIYVNVNNNYGEIQNTLTYEITAIYLSVELPSFEPTEIKTGESWGLDVKVVGSNANVYIYIDDNGGLVGSQTAGSTITYPITQGIYTGAHKLKVYAVAADDATVQTDPIESEYIYIYEGATQTVIATLLKDNTAMTMYNVLSVQYWVYKPEFNGDLPVTISIIDEMEEPLMSSTQVVTFTDGMSGIRKWDASLFEDTLIGDRKVRIFVDDTTRDIPIQINASDVKLSDIGGYDLLLRSAGRSNTDENVSDWSYGEYKVTFPEDLEFTDTASGWNYDADDNVALHLRRGREISINYFPFKDNPAYGNGEDVPGTKKGMTFSIELATRNCVKRDASVVRCVYNGVGFEFLANSMTFASNSESLSAEYKEDTRVRIDLVIEGQPITYTYDDNGVTKTSDEARMIVYVDGVYQQMLLTSTVSNFAQGVPQPITIGSEYCDVDIYCIRAYSTALDMKGITDNYAFDTPKVEDKIAIAKRCDVFDSQLNVSYPKLVTARPDLPIMFIGMETLPNSKTKIPVATTVYNNPLNPDNYDAGNPSWTSVNDEMGNQGTSSMNYPMPYRNFDWKTLSKSFVIGGQTYKKIPLYAGMPPIGKLTFKKDYASSEMANNVICTEMFNSMAVGLKDTFPNCLNDAQATLDYTKYRLGLKGIPFFIFKYWNNEYTPMGMFNFIPNKNEEEYLGFTKPFTWEQSRAQSWEIRDNNIFWDFYLDESAWDEEEGKLIKNCAFSYYEAIYPKDSANESGGESLDFGDASTAAQVEISKNETKDILRLHNWLVSTNQKLATGALLAEPYVDASGNTYNYDTPQYRLAKFVTEHSYYLTLDQWILYYIWREQFWMFDSGSKNLQLHTYDGQHWGCHVRDADTALGIDNEGKFVFPPYLEDNDFRTGSEFIFNQKTQPEGTETVLNGQMGAIWINIRDGFGDRIQQMYTTLYDNAALTKFNYDKCIAEFENHQGQWSEALYNFGSHQYYGGAPYSKWISSGLGDKKNQRRFWLYYGFRYRASKYHAGSSTNRITWRQFGTGSDLKMKTYSQMYVSLGFGAYDYKTTKRYRCLDLENGVTVKNEFTTNVNDVVMYLFNGDMITDIGNLYEFGNIGSLDLTNAKRLRWLRVGNKDEQAKYINTKLTELALTACDALEYLDLTSCQGFGTGTGHNGIYTLDLSKQTLLQEFYCKGATMSGITFPETPSLHTIHIGSGLSRLRLVNLSGLQDFQIESGEKIQSIIMRNCGEAAKTQSYGLLVNILSSEKNVLADVEIDGIDWVDVDADKLIAIGGISALNLKGRVALKGITEKQYNTLKEIYGESAFDAKSDFYIDAPPTIFIIGRTTILEGESETYYVKPYPEVSGTKTYRLITTRQGCSINPNTGVLTTVENGLNTSDIIIRATFTPSNGDPELYADFSVSVVKRTYPNDVTINGEENPITSSSYWWSTNTDGVNGDMVAEWYLSGDITDYFEIENYSLTECLLRMTFPPVGKVSGLLTLVLRKVYNNEVILTATKLVAAEYDGVIITSRSNAPIQASLYNAGLVANKTHTFKYEVEAITNKQLQPGESAETSIFNAQRDNIRSFSEFQYFRGLTSIFAYTFAGCINLADITIPNSITSVGDYAFAECSSLDSIYLPDGCKSIGLRSFMHCSNMNAIYIPGTTTAIANKAFELCGRLNIYVDDNNDTYSSMDGVLFSKNGASLIEYAKDVIEPNYSVPYGVQNIGGYAFYNCSHMESITIPSTLTSITGDLAFGGCSRISAIISDAVNAPSATISSFGDDYNSYTGRDSQPGRVNKLYIPLNATGYESGVWIDPLQNADKCGFNIHGKLTIVSNKSNATFSIKYTTISGASKTVTAGVGTCYLADIKYGTSLTATPNALGDNVFDSASTTITYNGDATITNNAYIYPDSVTINGASSIIGGKSTTFTASVSPSSVDIALTYTWTISGSSNATITPNGRQCTVNTNVPSVEETFTLTCVVKTSNNKVTVQDTHSVKLMEWSGFITATYNVTSTTSTTQLLSSSYSLNNVTLMEIDGVEVTPSTTYTFATTGSHNVRFSLNALNNAFKNVNTLVSIDFSEFIGISIINLVSCFESCSALALIDWGECSFPNVTNFGTCFCGCSSLKSIDLTPFNGAPITNMQYAFGFCASLESLDMSPINGNNVTNIANCFRGCTSLSTIEWGDTVFPKVTALTFCFYDCSKLTSIDLTPFYGAKITSVESCFNRCMMLETLDFSPLVDAKVTLWQYCFLACSALSTIIMPWSVAPSVGLYTFGINTAGYTGRNTYNTGKNRLYVPSGATGYDSGYWLDPLCNSEKCGFTLSATL